mmetsp:Transcript_44791/g.74459  ORF Transcript_44791/g.74459 Transcript_44791/m.74459 type:complete len:90 (+) Transcript_44791:820-1089(+)
MKCNAIMAQSRFFQRAKTIAMDYRLATDSHAGAPALPPGRTGRVPVHPAPPPPLRPLLPETAKSVVIIVCGGGAVDLDIINDFKAKFDL